MIVYFYITIATLDKTRYITEKKKINILFK